MKKLYLLLLILNLFLISCSESDLGDCFKNTGPIITETREVETFTEVNLSDNINLYLSTGEIENVKIEAGDNLMEKIEIIVEDSVLYLRNHNSCNWVRSFKKEINAYVTVREIEKISYNASGDVYCQDTLICDSILIDIHGGSGNINFLLNTKIAKIKYYYGTAELNLSGKSHISYLLSNSYGPINGLGLENKFLYMRSRSTNNCYVTAENVLEVEIFSIGNIYYTGNPYSISKKETNTGRLIYLDN